MNSKAITIFTAVIKAQYEKVSVQLKSPFVEDREHNDVRKGIKGYALDNFTLIV